MLRNVFTPPCGFDLSTTTVASAAGLAAISYWGYRLVVHPNGSHFVHETYYDQREGILGIAREAARPCGDNPADVQSELEQMAHGLREAPLRFGDYATPEAPAGASGDGSGGAAPEIG